MCGGFDRLDALGELVLVGVDFPAFANFGGLTVSSACLGLGCGSFGYFREFDV